MELGDGLNPFSVVCQGHPNTKDALALADKMATVESGASAISMDDASVFKTKDGRFPHTYGQVTDKLWAYALVVSVYTGPTSDLTTALVAGLVEASPLILQLESLYYHNKSQGLMIAIRVMLYFQRLVAHYFRKARSAPVGTDVPVPDFDRLMDELRMQAYDFLPRMPDTWMEVLKIQVPDVFQTPSPVPRLRGGGDPAPSGTRTPSARSVMNVRFEAKLVSRWIRAKGTQEGVHKLSDLRTKWQGEGAYECPKDTTHNMDMCLKYHLEKKCTETCPRAKTHRVLGNDQKVMFHAFLDKCQVAQVE